MRAVAVIEPGRVELVDLPEPTPGPYEARIKTTIAAAGQADAACRTEDEQGFTGLEIRALLERVVAGAVGGGDPGRLGKAHGFWHQPQGRGRHGNLLGEAADADAAENPIADRQAGSVREVIDSGVGVTRETMTVIQGREKWYRTSINPVRDGEGRIAAALAFAVVGVATVFVEPAWGITSFVIALLVGLTPSFRR